MSQRLPGERMMGLAIPNDSGRYSLAWHESVRDASDTMRHCSVAGAQPNIFFDT